MSVFLIFALAGLLMFILAVVSVPGSLAWRLAGYRRVTRRSGLIKLVAWIISLLVIGTLIAGVALKVTWNAVGIPDSPGLPFDEYLGSRFVGSAVYGIAFGVLFGYWFGTLVFRKPTEKPSYVEVALSAVLGILLLFGLLGQKAITEALTRVTSLEVAGTKVGLAAPASPSGFVGGTATSNGQTPSPSPDQSQAFSSLSDLVNSVERDRHYFYFITNRPIDRAVSDKVDPYFDRASQFAKQFVSPLSDCVRHFYNLTGDDTRSGQLLVPLASKLRKFADYGSADLVAAMEWEESFWTAVTAIRDEPSDAYWKDPENLDCEGLKTLGKQHDSKADVLALLRDRRWRADPYFNLLIASMLAYAHENGAAVLTLENWIRRYGSDDSDVALIDGLDRSNAATMRRVERIRIRGAILTFMEEWLHGFTVARPSTALSDYQRENIRKLLDDIDSDPFLNKMTKKTIEKMAQSGKDMLMEKLAFRYDPIDSGKCDLDLKMGLENEDDGQLILFLVRSKISLELNWIFAALDSPDFYDKFQSTSSKYAEELINTDLSCLNAIKGADPGAINNKRKDILEAYARVKLAHFQGTQKEDELVGEENKRTGLENAIQAVRLAKRVISKKSDPANSKSDDSAEHNYLAPLATNSIEQATADLTKLENQIRGALAR